MDMDVLHIEIEGCSCHNTSFVIHLIMYTDTVARFLYKVKKKKEVTDSDSESWFGKVHIQTQIQNFCLDNDQGVKMESNWRSTMTLVRLDQEPSLSLGLLSVNTMTCMSINFKIP